MNLIKRALYGSTILFLFYSCVNSISEKDLTSDLIPIKIATQIYLEKTRIIDTDFEESDEIGLYVTIQPATLSEERHVDNTKFVYSTAKGFIPESIEYFPDKENKCDFTAYYPYKKKAINKNETTIKVSTKTSQSDWNSFSSSDFLVAGNKDITPTKNPVELAFDHKLYRVNLHIKPGDSYTLADLLTANPTIEITDVCTEAIYDFATDKFAGQNNTADIIPYGTWEIKDGTLTGKSAILVPQTFVGTHAILHIEVNGKTFISRLGNDYVFKSGEVEDYLITLSERVSTSISPSINGWGTPTKKDIDAEETTTSVSVSIDDLTFQKSGIYHIISGGNLVAEICKEYLLSNGVIDSQAIVVYPVKDGKTDLKNGLVLKIINESQSKHGGKVSWGENDNKLTYTAGSLPPINSFFISKEGEISADRPDNVSQLEVKEYVLTDTRGTETIRYPITKIATQYWMASNLEATKYQDGSDISKDDDFSEVSPKYSIEDEEHFFYNSAAIANAPLNPEGWRIGNETDWTKLTTYIADNASTLKKGSAWTNPGTNLTGFNAEITGLYNETYTNNEYTCYWCTSDADPTVATKSFALSTNNKINPTGNKNTLGIAIRCVKE